MRILSDISGLRRARAPLFLAIGFFDGIHRGHRKVIAEAVAGAAGRGGRAWALTFQPHPEKLLNPETAPPLLTSHEHKLRLLGGLGLAGTLVLPFTRELAALEPGAFADLLLEGMPALEEILVGRNWRFGRGGKGDARLLARLVGSRDVRLKAISPVARQGRPISSTRIRREIMRGNIAEAAVMLGRPYSVLGTVVRGRSIGRRLGFPTANLDVHNEVLPPDGVYAVRAATAGQRYGGVLSIGSRPTFGKTQGEDGAVEVHMLDYSGTLYGRDIEVFLVKKIRSLVAFDSPEELSLQIGRDTQIARKILENEKEQK